VGEHPHVTSPNDPSRCLIIDRGYSRRTI